MQTHNGILEDVHEVLESEVQVLVSGFFLVSLSSVVVSYCLERLVPAFNDLHRFYSFYEP